MGFFDRKSDGDDEETRTDKLLREASVAQMTGLCLQVEGLLGFPLEPGSFYVGILINQLNHAGMFHPNAIEAQQDVILDHMEQIRNKYVEAE